MFDDDDDLFDELFDYGVFEDHNDNKKDNRKSGSCLSFIIFTGGMIAAPLALLAHFFLA